MKLLKKNQELTDKISFLLKHDSGTKHKIFLKAGKFI